MNKIKLLMPILGISTLTMAIAPLTSCGSEEQTASSIRLNNEELELKINQTKKLKATVTPQGSTIKWKSNHEDIATVDSSGNVTAKAVGNAVIIATANGKSATCDITVTNGDAAALTSIEIQTPASTLEFEVDETFNSDGLIILAKYSDNTSKGITSGSSGLTTDYDAKTFTTSDIGDEKIVTVSYEDNNITKTATYKINVVSQAIKKTLIKSPILGTTAGYALSDGGQSEQVSEYKMQFVKGNKYEFTMTMVQGYYSEDMHFVLGYDFNRDEGLIPTTEQFVDENHISATLNGKKTGLDLSCLLINGRINFIEDYKFKAGDILKIKFTYLLDDAELMPCTIAG